MCHLKKKNLSMKNSWNKKKMRLILILKRKWSWKNWCLFLETNTPNCFCYWSNSVIFVYLDLFCHTSQRSKNRYGYGFFSIPTTFFSMACWLFSSFSFTFCLRPWICSKKYLNWFKKVDFHGLCKENCERKIVPYFWSILVTICNIFTPLTKIV